MRVLAVDTTSPRASLAVVEGSSVLADEHNESEAGHSGWLLPAVAAVLRRLGFEVGALDLLAVTCGPGSFTGLRVGLGSVQGLALASGRPCLGVSTLDVLARGARGSADTIVAVMDAFRGEVFWAAYDREAGLRGECFVSGLEAALERAPRGSAFVGDVAVARRDAIAAAVEDAVFPATSGFLAVTLATIALERAREAGPPSALRPLYLRGAAIRPARP